MTTEASQTGMFFSTYSRKTLIFRQCTFSISARIKKGKKIKMIGLDIAKGSYRFRRLGPQLTSDGIHFTDDVMCRFVSKREYPQKMISDAGLQPVAAGKELGTIVHSWEWNTMRNFEEKGGMDWETT